MPVSVDKGNPLPRRLKFSANRAKSLNVLFAHAIYSRSAKQVIDQSDEVFTIPFLMQNKTGVNTHLPISIEFTAQQAHAEQGGPGIKLDDAPTRKIPSNRLKN